MPDEPEPAPDDALAKALEENRRRSEAMADSMQLSSLGHLPDDDEGQDVEESEGVTPDPFA